MADLVRDLMNPKPIVIDAKSSIERAAEVMRANDVGDVLVVDNGRVQGIMTDRDIVVRAIADYKHPAATLAGQCCSEQPQVISADATADQAIEMMRHHALRRLPVVQDDQLVGILSLGDLAIAEDRRSALADISAAKSNL